jgi:RNA polymerase sigma factor (sigma-70 family)
MANLATGSVARQIGALFEGGSAAGLSDRQLLDRFRSGRDAGGEAAFAALVARHGPMVLGVCRQVLGDHQLAEDAFQAVFLVLARRARSIRDPDLLGNWLYGVALRAARCARDRRARRRKNEELGTMMRSGPSPTTPPADEAVAAREHAEALHGEIERLPESFRLPVVLCYLEGLTVHEAARRLRWSHGTVRSRMARAREKLRRALVRRGVVLPAAALAAVLDSRSASATVSSPLCDTTTRAAIRFAAGHAAGEALPASTTALAQEVLKSMLIHKLKLVGLTLLVLGAVATGAGYVSMIALAQSRQGEPHPSRERAVGAAPGALPLPDGRGSVRRGSPDPDPARMTVVGRVLDPGGKPVAGAPIEVVGLPRNPLLDRDENAFRLVLLGRGETGPDGRFRLEAPRTSTVGYFSAHAMSAAPGCGLGWVNLNVDAPEPAAEIRLRPEKPIRGRLVDVNGQPAAGVELRVDFLSPPQIDGELPDSIWMHDGRPPEGCRLWSRPIRSDDQGRFTVPGVGRGLRALLDVRDPRFAPQQLDLLADDRNGPKEATLALQPARIVEGRVLDADTGRPVPGALLSLSTNTLTRARADDQGRFRGSPPAGDRFNSGERFNIGIFPPEGSPYLIPRIEVAWPKGALRQPLDIKLRRGVLIRVKVTEQGTGRPLAGSTIEPHFANGPQDVQACREASVASGGDGTIQVVVPPGQGHLLVFGPTPDYLLEVIGLRMLLYGRPGGDRYYAHKIIPYEAKAGDRPHEVTAALRPAKTLKGRVLDPQGQPVAHALMITRLHIEPFNAFWRGDLGFALHARDGRFELHGVDPEGSAPVFFLDPDREWGATFEASGKRAGEDGTVQLQPCGRAKARLVGPAGQAVARAHPWLEIVATPAGTEFSRDRKEQGQLSPDVALLGSVDPKHYRYKQRPLTDAEGRVAMPALIPGAPYRLLDRSDPKSPVRKEFTVQPGEIIDLGDIPIHKPSP